MASKSKKESNYEGKYDAYNPTLKQYTKESKISATTAKHLLDAKIIAVDKRNKKREERQKEIEGMIDEGKKQQELVKRQNEMKDDCQDYNEIRELAKTPGCKECDTRWQKLQGDLNAKYETKEGEKTFTEKCVHGDIKRGGKSKKKRRRRRNSRKTRKKRKTKRRRKSRRRRKTKRRRRRRR